MHELLRGARQGRHRRCKCFSNNHHHDAMARYALRCILFWALPLSKCMPGLHLQSKAVTVSADPPDNPLVLTICADKSFPTTCPVDLLLTNLLLAAAVCCCFLPSRLSLPASKACVASGAAALRPRNWSTRHHRDVSIIQLAIGFCLPPTALASLAEWWNELGISRVCSRRRD